MTIATLFILAIALVPLGLSIRGLLNQTRALSCIIAGIVLAIGSLPGALHAWGESQSLPWTAAYVTIALIGATSAVRQFRLPKTAALAGQQSDEGTP